MTDFLPELIMYSKLLKLILPEVLSWVLTLTLTLAVIFSVSCGLKLGEKNKSENVLEFKSASCLSSSLENLKVFLNGEASSEQVTESIFCLQEAIKTFKENVRGKNNDVYSSEEISNFVTSKLLKGEKKINQEFMLEIMNLKVVLVGGHTHIITKDEIDGIISIIERLKPEIAKLAPHMKILTSKWRPQSTGAADAALVESKFVQAKNALEAFLNRLGNLLASTERSYQISDLMNLIIEITKFSKGNDESLKKIVTTKGLIIKFKESIIGGNSALTGKEWLPFTRTLGEVYSQILRYKYFYDNLKAEQVTEKWKVHQQMTIEIGGLIRDLLIFKESHVFTTTELSELILVAQDLKYVNSKPAQKKFTQKGLDSLFKSLWNNILNTPENRLAKKTQPGFNSEALTVLQTEVSYFVENQIIIGELFATQNEYAKDLLVAELLKKTRGAGLQELHRAVSANGLMNFNTEAYLKILTPNNGRYHLEDLNKANISRALSRVIIRSYASDLDRVNKLTGVTLEEVQFGFDQLKDMIFNLELVDPDKSTSFVASRFRESNLFLSVSNGDALASFEEVDHLVLHIMSGMARAKSLEKIAMQKCVKSMHETTAKIEFEETCLWDLYFSEVNSFMDLPGFAALKTEKDNNGELKLSPELNKKYYAALLSAAGHIPSDNQTVLLCDANLFPHVVQYVEMIFFTHDLNSNGFLEKNEALNAYPVFAETIKLLKKTSFFKDLEEKDFMGAFVWLLKKGTPFPVPLMKKFAKDYECNLKEDSKTCTYDWTLSSTRVDIGKIFLLIASLTTPQPPVEDLASSSPE